MKSENEQNGLNNQLEENSSQNTTPNKTTDGSKKYMIKGIYKLFYFFQFTL